MKMTLLKSLKTQKKNNKTIIITINIDPYYTLQYLKINLKLNN